MRELFHDNRGEKSVIHQNMKWPVVLKSEIRINSGQDGEMKSSRTRWEFNNDFDRFRIFGY